MTDVKPTLPARKPLLSSAEPVGKNGCDANGLNIIGYFESIFGVAEAARLYLEKSLSSSVPVNIFPIQSAAHARLSNEEIKSYSAYYVDSPVFNKNLFFVNADEIGNIKKCFPELFEGKYNAAVWWWEFEDYFSFHDAFNHVDEVVVFSDFIAKAIKKDAPGDTKIRKMTFPFMCNWKLTIPKNVVRNSLGISDDHFVFLYSFDLFSGFNRKNPLALLDAFEIAARKCPNIKLVLKIGHSDHFKTEYKSIQDRIRKLSIKNKTVLLTESIPRNHLMSLVNAVDAYVSLHRSEGFGLGMLEAMYVGKPVIATSYGGNLEFMNENNSMLIEYELVELEHNFGPYKKGWLWAEPDINSASEYMIKLASDGQLCGELAEKGQGDVLNQYDKNKFIEELHDFVSG